MLSAYYPPQLIARFIGGFFALDGQFRVLLLSVVAHYLLASIGWYYLIESWSNSYVALFGAITLTYSAYNIKQQPCIVYTIAWFPWMLYGIATHNLLLSSLTLGLTLLAGYYPIGLQTILIAIGAAMMWGAHPLFVPIGFILGLPQLIPFSKYLPKTIRTYQHDSIGKVPWWHFFSLIFPKLFRFPVNGVGYWEMSYYVGIIPILLLPLATSRVWPLALISAGLMMGCLARKLPRIPARWSFSFQFALGWMATSGFNNCCIDSKIWMSLILIQAVDLLINNSPLFITSPFSELPERPSRAFNTELTEYLKENLGDGRVSGLPYPLFTGHINRLRTLGYSGGMQLKLMAKWREDTNPNGSGEHDWFRTKGDDELLDRYRVKYAYTSKPINWNKTPIKRLYENPRLKD